MGDARATATLLASYLDPNFGYAPLPEHMALPSEALAVIWPTQPSGVPSPIENRRAQTWRGAPKAPPAAKLVELVAGFSLVDALDEGAPEGLLAYLEMLAGALEDGRITVQEAAALAEVAALHELSGADVERANRGFLLTLAHGALDDGRVSQAERAELYEIAELLGLERRLVLSVLDRAEVARGARLSEGLEPLPAGWSHGEALRVGDKGVFTGGDVQQRERLELTSTSLGVRVLSGVSRKTVMLVSDGTMDGTKAASAAALGTRVVHPDQFEALLNHLQPAKPKAIRGSMVG
jgi:DNA polymerase-3 subunit epsilon